MSEKSKTGWQWSDLDPLTRSVVAAFAWRIGDESKGDIPDQDFIDAVNETFGSVTAGDISRTAGWSGPEGIRNTFMWEFSKLEDESIAHMTRRLGHLAGGTEALLELAAQAGKQITDEERRSYDAIPALRVLSELAMGTSVTPPTS